MSGSSRVLLSLLAVLLLALTPTSTRAQQPGDALQLFSYEVTNATKPDVSDGLIAPASDSADWKASYVRQMTVGIGGDPTNDPRKLTLLAGNTSDTLYIAGTVRLENSSDQNRLFLYFDEGNDGTLDGTSSNPEEYRAVVSVNDPARGGYWDGSQWTDNATVVATGGGRRKGISGNLSLQFRTKDSTQQGRRCK